LSVALIGLKNPLPPLPETMIPAQLNYCPPPGAGWSRALRRDGEMI